jgi:integrase
MKKHEYTSVLKDEMSGFLKMRQNQGFKDGHRFILVSLDKYLTSRNVITKPLTASIVDAWIAETCKGLSSRSVNGYIGYFNKFAKYLSILGIESFALEHIRVHDSYVPYIFSESEIDNIFAVADDINVKTYTTSQMQFAMLLRLLYGCGLRLGEALSLKKSDIDNESGVLLIRAAKGNRDRFVPMEHELSLVMNDYIENLLHNEPTDAWVFESTVAGKPRGHAWALYSFHKALSKAGIDMPALPPRQRNICLHCLRHTFIVRSFRKQDLAGIDNYDPAASISVYVGHMKLYGTQRYLHMTAENSVDIINATTEYSKGMFPSVPSEQDDALKNETPAIIKTPDFAVNNCSTGMFPEVPR